MAMSFHTITGESFWKKVEQELNLVIPNHLKFIFKLQSIDNPDILVELNEADLFSIEEFVRSNVYEREIPVGSDTFQYYGNFSPNNFKFSVADLELIKNIRELIITRDREFWKATSERMESQGVSPPTELRVELPVEPPAELQEHVVARTYQSQWKSSTFLNMLKYASSDNYERDPRGHRFLRSLKLVCSHIFMVGGRLLYDFLHANLPIPGPSTVERFMHNESLFVAEGIFQVFLLNHFLESRHLPKEVVLCEDQTAISGRIQYDSTTNEIVGFVLPQNANAMPIANTFKATSAKAIENYFKNNKPATFSYNFMAQPLDPNAPAFCLLVFGSDNKMSFADVVKRWNYMISILKSHGISVSGCSGDGDTRLLKAMRILSKLGVDSIQYPAKSDAVSALQRDLSDIKCFHAELLPETVYVQDTVHIGNKMKNRLFKQSIILPMGNFTATSGDIRALTEITTKDKHFLNETDLTLNDKMNFASTMRICHPRIWKLLKEKIPHSDGTQLYLKIVFFSMQSMLSTQLQPLERAYAIWFGVFFLRMWRFWIFNKSSYSVVHNYISLNSYVCLELNAHALLNLIFKCLKEGSFQRFLPWMYGSQPCENNFRNLRSMSSTFSTVVNCSVLDALHRLGKLQQLADIQVNDFEADRETIHFPRSRFLNGTHEKQEKIYPEMVKIDGAVSVETIKDVLVRAKNDAWNETKKLGMTVPIEAGEKIQTDFHGAVPENLCDVIDEEDIQRYEVEVEDEINSDDEDVGLLSDPNNPVEFPEFPDDVDELTETSSKTVLKDARGNLKVVKKSSLCWYFSNCNKKLSSDRNIRVKECDVTFQTLHRMQTTETSRQNRVFINDFCLFNIANSETCLLGLVSGFAYMDERSWKNLAYTKNCVDLEQNHKKPIGVFARWFSINSNDRSLDLYPLETQGYISIEQYKLTIPAPMNENGKFVLPEIVYNQIQSLL